MTLFSDDAVVNAKSFQMALDRLPKRVATAPSRVVGMVNYNGRIFVACETGVYELRDEELHPVRFAPEPAP